MCSKLQYRGDGAEVRVEIAAELKALAADDSAVLPVPPNLDVARANELVLPEFTTGEWPPQTRPSTTEPRMRSQKPTLSSSGGATRSSWT